jgi:hypothetical protein
MILVALLPRPLLDHLPGLAKAWHGRYSETRLMAVHAQAFAHLSAHWRSAKGTAMRALSLFSVAAGLALVLATSPAMAECDVLAFEVNDYGKEGPTRDALALLDKHIVTTMAKRNIKDYRVGEKNVKCELFLDFIVFDEHTCTAHANVCWGKDLKKIKAAPKATIAKAPSPKEPSPKASSPKAAEKK